MRIHGTIVALALALAATGCNQTAEEAPASETAEAAAEESPAEGEAIEEPGAEENAGEAEASAEGEEASAEGEEGEAETPEPASTPSPIEPNLPADMPILDPEIMTPEMIEDVIDSLPPPAAGSPLSYCPALERNAPADQCEAFTNLVNNAALGVASLGAAKTMRMGQAYPVRLIVGKKDKQEQIEAVAGSAGAVTTGELKLAPWICGSLQAPEFDIRGDERQCKRRGASSQVSFEWTVVPKIARKLTLSAKAESLAGKDGEMLDQVDSEVITVDVDASNKVKVNSFMADLTEALGGLRNLLLALLAVIGVIGTIIWRVRKIWKNPDADPNASNGAAEGEGANADQVPDEGKPPPPAGNP